MTDPRFLRARSHRHDELQDEIDQFLREQADLVENARSAIHLSHRFVAWHRATANRAPLPSLCALRRRFARSLAQQRTPDAVKHVRSRFAETSHTPPVRLPIEDPAQSFRRPHARPVLYVDPHTGAIISLP